MKRVVTFLAIVSLSVGSVFAAAKPSKEELRAKLIQRLEAHPVRKASYWSTLREGERPKIGPASRDIIEYLLIDNVLNGFRERPVPSKDMSMRDDLLAAWDSLPAKVRTLAAARLAGIFLVDDLGGSAYTEVVGDTSGTTVGAFMVMDAKVMNQPPNAWMSWKENTPFRDGAIRVDARIAPAGSKNRVASIRYLLLHELGHVIGETVGAHPPWGPAGTIGEIALSEYPFLDIGWQDNPDGKGVVTKYETGRLGKFAFYQPKERRMANDTSIGGYRWLRTTPFATLYSLNSIYDDFAEAFANYVHVEMLREPYSISVVEGDTVHLMYDACWDEPRCEKKRAWLEKLLGEG
ncbi:MAG: hypothetical protein AAF654_00320 [Myxococcota bacterium]